MRVQRLPQRKSRAMNPAFSLCAALLSHQPRAKSNVSFRQQRQSDTLKNVSSWRAERTHYFSYLEAHHLDWRQVNNETVLQYRDVQDQNLSGHTKEHLNRRTINTRIRTVGRFYAFAFEQGFIEKNPIKYKKLSFRRRPDTDLLAHLGAAREQEIPAVTFERLAQPKIRWRPQREIMQWLNSIEDWRDKLIAKLIYQTGSSTKPLRSRGDCDLVCARILACQLAERTH